MCEHNRKNIITIEADGTTSALFILVFVVQAILFFNFLKKDSEFCKQIEEKYNSIEGPVPKMPYYKEKKAYLHVYAKECLLEL